ncbi:uncharacterized protein C8A04DRAFT_27677 [Dichotomopilus funicola]|uniref:Uncharacterized protein n=1 Tax=Dichotomopilus funicola TaxID=1934379 RepID=A0AAN6V434_9PEZI|nr:hypothetical protein C8A04DRAFT_27677 [Dichotomopilus funicola]
MPSHQSTRPGDAMADLANSLLHSPKDTRSPTATQQTTTSQSSSTSSQDNNNTKSADRGMSSTNNWKPALDRRQSWDAQEYKHDVLSRQYGLGEGGERQQREGAEGGVRKRFSEV